MYEKPKESDWKHFRNKVVSLREQYLKAKNEELVRLLTAADKTPTEQFWDTYERMRKEKESYKTAWMGTQGLVCHYPWLI